MIHATQLQSLFDLLDNLHHYDLSALPADLEATLKGALQEKQKLTALDQRLIIGVRDTRNSTDYYPILVPRDRDYTEQEFLATFDTSQDNSEDFTYLYGCEGTTVTVIEAEAGE